MLPLASPPSTKHLWQQSECRHMSRADQGEVPSVDSRDLGDAQALRDGDHGHISRVETSVSVKPDQFGHAPYISGMQLHQLELFDDKIKELCVNSRPHVPVDRPAGFDQDRRWQEQRPFQPLKESNTRSMMLVVSIDDGDQRASVQKCGAHTERLNRSASRSSTRSERSPSPEAPIPAIVSRRRTGADRSSFVASASSGSVFTKRRSRCTWSGDNRSTR
jgi:hypothetical protein